MPRIDDDETGELFPELQLHDPRHKAVFNAAKKLYVEQAARNALLNDSKQKVDGCRERLVALMGEAGMTRFRFRGLKVELIVGPTKAQVELDEDVDEGETDE